MSDYVLRFYRFGTRLYRRISISTWVFWSLYQEILDLEYENRRLRKIISELSLQVGYEKVELCLTNTTTDMIGSSR